MKRTPRLLSIAGATLVTLGTAVLPAANPAAALGVPVEIAGQLTGVPSGVAKVKVAAGRTTTLPTVYFHAGAAISGRVTTADGPLFLAQVSVITSTHVLLATGVAGADGTYAIGGLPPTTHGLYVCAEDRVDDGYQKYGSRCYGATARWSKGTATPAGAKRVLTTSGEVTGGIDIPVMSNASIAVDTTKVVKHIVFFDTAGHVVRTQDEINGSHSVRTKGLVPGTYLVCVSGGTGVPTCNGNKPWPTVVSNAQLTAPPAADTLPVTVAGGKQRLVTIAQPTGGVISGSIVATGDNDATVGLFAGNDLVDAAHPGTSSPPSSQTFSFAGLPDRDDYAVCTWDEAGLGNCWQSVAYSFPYDTHPAAPPAGVTRLTMTNASTDSSVHLTLTEHTRPDPGGGPSPTFSGTVRDSGGKPLVGATVNVYAGNGSTAGAQLLLQLTTNGAGRWSTGNLVGPHVTVCAFGGTTKAGTPPPTDGYVPGCYDNGTPITVKGGDPNRMGLDITLFRSGKIAATLRAGSTSWRGFAYVAGTRTGTVIAQYPNPYTGATATATPAITSVGASSAGYVVCFIPENGNLVSGAHPTGLLPQCANGKDWFGQLVNQVNLYLGP